MSTSVSPLGRLARRLPPLYFIFALILVSALALGRYSYKNARQVADQGERSLAESNRLLGRETLYRIENFIIDSDRSLFDLVDLEHLENFARDWSKNVRLSEAIEAALVLDEHHQIMRNGYVSKKARGDADAFQRLFQEKILPQLPLARLEVDLHKHLHAMVDGRDYLISYIKRRQTRPDGTSRVYYVAFKINLEYLLQKFLPSLETFATLKGRGLYALVDDRGRIVFGEEVSAPREFLYEEHFPTTLYLWRLQMAAPDATRIVAETQSRRLSETTLIVLMVATILVGIAFLVYAVSKERRANQLKSDFISNVSHELKTPLSLIRMFGELLALGKLKTPEKGTEYAEIITREAERLSHLIDNVLDFARIERGKAAYDFKVGDLGEVVARAVDVYRFRLEREGVRLQTSLEEHVPPTLLDENAMTLVLLNLIDNAVKYGGDRPEITVGLRAVAGGIELAVSDKGAGIARDEQRRIFDRFYRTREARGKNARGSGIGLSLVKHITEAHGGRVAVESEPGRGATFTVVIPLRGGREGGPGPAEEVAA